MTAASFVSSGITRPVFCGAVTTTNRFLLLTGNHSRASLLISASVISGRNRWCNAYSSSALGKSFINKKVANIFTGAACRWSVFLFQCEAFVVTQDIYFLTSQFCFREAEARDAFRFRQQCLQTTFNSIFLNKSTERCDLLRPRQKATSSAESQNKGCVRLLGELSKARVQHSGKEPINCLLPVGANRAFRACRQKRVNLDACGSGFFVGVDGKSGV